MEDSLFGLKRREREKKRQIRKERNEDGECVAKWTVGVYQLVCVEKREYK